MKGKLDMDKSAFQNQMCYIIAKERYKSFLRELRYALNFIDKKVEAFAKGIGLYNAPMFMQGFFEKRLEGYFPSNYRFSSVLLNQ